MFEIDFKRKYTITSNLDDVNVIVDLLDPSSYARLFVSSGKQDDVEENMIDNFMSKEDAILFRDYRKCKERLVSMEKCCKNLASLAMLYKAIVANYSDIENGVCCLVLNTMQAYELHITLVTHMRKKMIEVSAKEKELDDGIATFTIDKRDEILKLYNEVNTLKALNLNLIETVTREVLYAIEEKYDSITPEEHVEYCIL